MDIAKLSRLIHKANKKKGFWDKPRNEGEVLMLCITELSEMIEADRKSRNGSIQLFYTELNQQSKFKYSKRHKLKIKREIFEKHIKDSIGDELADAFIRMCDYCIGFKIGITMADIERSATTNKLESRKFENLGDELLTICGMIDKMRRSMKLAHARLIFAHIIWLAEQLDIPLELHVKFKMWYNNTRPKMHGKKY